MTDLDSARLAAIRARAVPSCQTFKSDAYRGSKANGERYEDRCLDCGRLPENHLTDKDVAYLLTALARLQAERDEYQRSFALCAIHAPNVWEGDGTCVICEGTIASEAAALWRTQLAETKVKLEAAEAARDEAQRKYKRIAEIAVIQDWTDDEALLAEMRELTT